MEQELRNNLLSLAREFAAARTIALPTVGRLAAGDWRFFDRLLDEDKSFTARKYDEIIQWFSDNWPTTAQWPVDLVRPAVAEQAGAA
ncbi:hypothetical protein SAMN03159423_4825 [Bradyrhizobium sp. NFR13]|uniref:hypothetical protein n=1 Tax=Bradyrhizobium sp. NFR13 TaxID=1566285 RepID=UPI0008E896DF|nr:hypothetical protein [Bradyrhizobium sp. NFR13]SFM00080.1 hypothetical protein SAMN03159423_4825 [Bradyrhizobium sp. NFR13]